jgi:hypothetical protein
MAYCRNDYAIYYSNIDSAEYYVSIKDYQSAFNLYKTVFNDFDGFPDDYLNALSVSVNLYKKGFDPFIQGFKKVRGYRNDLKSDLTYWRNKGLIDSKETKRILKVFRNSNALLKKNRKGTRLILKLMIKDQRARRSGKNIHQTDSINNLKLQEAIQKTPTFLDHRQYGFLTKNMLDILIFHQEYKLWGTNFGILVENIMQGNLSRETVLYLLERGVVWGNGLFKLENDSLIYLEGKNQRICDSLNFSYSIFGGFRQYNATSKQHIITPINPEYSVEIVDKMRKYLLYSSYDLYVKTNRNFSFPDKNDYCDKMKK